jgi:hypothetical protein
LPGAIQLGSPLVFLRSPIVGIISPFFVFGGPFLLDSTLVLFASTFVYLFRSPLELKTSLQKTTPKLQRAIGLRFKRAIC